MSGEIVEWNELVIGALRCFPVEPWGWDNLRRDVVYAELATADAISGRPFCLDHSERFRDDFGEVGSDVPYLSSVE